MPISSKAQGILKQIGDINQGAMIFKDKCKTHGITNFLVLYNENRYRSTRVCLNCAEGLNYEIVANPGDSNIHAQL